MHCKKDCDCEGGAKSGHSTSIKRGPWGPKYSGKSFTQSFKSKRTEKGTNEKKKHTKKKKGGKGKIIGL